MSTVNVLFNPDFWETATPEMVRQAVRNGADVKAKTANDNTPLHLAAMLTTDPEVIRTLVELGAEINAKNHKGATPLICAAWTSVSSDVVLALLELGADQETEITFTITHTHSACDLARRNKALIGTPAYERLRDGETKVSAQHGSSICYGRCAPPQPTPCLIQTSGLPLLPKACVQQCKEGRR